MRKFLTFLSDLKRIVIVAAVLFGSWAIVFLAVYGAARLAERFGIC